MRFVFTAEQDPAGTGWRIVHHFGGDRFVGEEQFCSEAAARAWADALNMMAEPDPAWWAFDGAPWDFLYPQLPF